MKILGKVIKDGKHVGFSVDDSGLLVQYPNKAIFSELVFMGLIDSGYTFEGYSIDEIRDPSGKYITELPEVEFNADPDEWFSLNEIDVMPDAQCSKYYTVGVTAVEFRQAENVVINTREELLKYLDKCYVVFEKLGYSEDLTPLNNRVNKEALFDLEELYDSNNFEVACNLRNKLVKYIRSLIFKSYEEKEKLVDWLIKKGALTNDNPSEGEFLKAYFSWGFPGIKSKCTRVNYKLADSYRVGATKGGSNNILSGRIETKTLMDADRNVYLNGQKYNLRNHVQSNTNDIVLENDGKAIELLRRNMRGKKYTPVTVYERYATDKIVMEFITERDYRFKVEFDCSAVCLSEYQYNGWVPSVMENWFNIKTILPDVSVTFKEAKTEYLYQLQSIAYAAAMQLIKDSVEPTPTKSSIEMVTKDGVNMLSAINYLAKDVSDVNSGDYDSSKAYLDRGEGIKVRLTSPLKTLASPIPQEILSYFDEDLSQDMDKEQFSDFLEQFTIFPLNNPSDVNEEIPKLPPKNMLGEDYAAELEKYRSELKFAIDCLNNNITVGAFGDGKLNEEIFDVRQIAKPFITLALINKWSLEEASAEFERILDDSDYFEKDELCRRQYNSFRGYFKDLARLRMARGTSKYVIYVNRVIREISNLPAEKQRPYLLECACLNTGSEAVGNIINRVASVIRKADTSMYPDAIAECIYNSANFHALQLMMFICCGKINEDFLTEEGVYEIKLPTGTGKSLIVKLDKSLFDAIKSITLQQKFITVKDYCEKEFMEGSSRFNFFCINANITPWSVTPKKGYKLYSYAFMPNYYDQFEYGEARKMWMAQVVKDGGRIGTSLHNVPESQMVIPNSITSMTIMTSGMSEDNFWKSPQHGLPELETIVKMYGEETIKAYFLRWFLAKKELADQGITLVSIPLKQDYNYGTLAPYFGMNVPETENVTSEDSSVAKNFLEEYHVKQVGTETGRLAIETSKKVKASLFDIRRYDYSQIKNWRDLLLGTYVFKDITSLLPNRIAFKNLNTIININSLSQEMLEKFANSGICYQLSYNQFLFKGLIRDFVVEVK